MEIMKAGLQVSGKGPSEWFTGSVRVDPLFQAPEPALVQIASVTFEPGARTAWHTSGRADSHCHRRAWLDSTLGWTGRRDPAR